MAWRSAVEKREHAGDAACRNPLTCVAVAAIAGSLWVTSAQAQAPPRAISRFHPDASSSAERLLRNAASQASAAQWSEALTIYQRVITQYGDTVAEVPADDPEAAVGAPRQQPESRLYVDVREYCQRQIAALPAEARTLYQSRVDPEAERWYQVGARTRDRGVIRKVVDQAFCSSFGDDALDLLGDLAFQDGEIAEALLYYRRLVPDSSGEPPGLVHPDPNVDLARVAAKILLCRAVLGETPPTPADVAAFRAAYPKAAGAFAGRDGLLADSLAAALNEDHLAVPAPFDGRWPTFAGSATRTRIAPKPVLAGQPQWRVPLPGISVSVNQAEPFMRRGGFVPQQLPITPERLLAYHPIILGDQIVVGLQDRMVSIPLTLAEKTEVTSLLDLDSVKLWEQRLPADSPSAHTTPGMPRFTLTAAGDRVFARLGPLGSRGVTAGSTLVAVRKTTEGKLLWRKTPGEILPVTQRINQGTFLPAFEGTPVADLQAVYVAMTIAGPMTSTYVVSLDAETGAIRWMRKVGEASATAENAMVMGGAYGNIDIGLKLLTLDGPTVYYQTNLGAVLALEAATGSVRWIATYPSHDVGGVDRGTRTRRTGHRDLNPAVVHEGLVIVAPDDADTIYAFHAATGRLAWKCDTELGAIAHVLGIAYGNVIATGEQVWLINAKTGKRKNNWPNNTQYAGFGRGLLAGKYIYWPTKESIQVLDAETGERTSDQEPIDLKSLKLVGGNLAIGDGCLVIAGIDASTFGTPEPLQCLVVLSHNARKIQRLNEEIVRGIDPGPNSLRAARLHEGDGHPELALERLADAVRLAKPGEIFDGELLETVARSHQYRLLMKLAGTSAADKAWGEAIRRYERAAQVALGDRDRLAARLRQADAEASSGMPARAVATLQDVLADSRFRVLGVVSDDRQSTVRADLWVADRLGALIKQHGRSVYESFDRKASELFLQGQAERSTRALEAIGTSYPAARILPDALLALGMLRESMSQPAEAAKVYARVRALAAATETQRARALCGLGRALDAQKLWAAAEEAYERALTKYPDVKLEEHGAGATVASYVSGQLAREPLAKQAKSAHAAHIPLPLARRWEQTLPKHVLPIRADGSPASADLGRVFLAERTTIRPLDAQLGSSPWRFDLGGEPVWVGYLADRVLVASGARLVALGNAKGDLLWEFRGDTRLSPRPELNPFARKEANIVEPDPKAMRLGRFQIVDNHILCRRGDSEIVSIDGDSGSVRWSYSPGSATLSAGGLVGRECIVLQAVRTNSKSLLALDPETGRCREFPRTEEETAWVRNPLRIDDDHVAVAVDSRSVALIDVRTGKDVWVHRQRVAPRAAPHASPRLMGESGRLFAIFDGSELVRLSSDTGEALWTTVLSDDDISEWSDAFAIDADRFYCATSADNRSTLTAYGLADGKPEWRQYLLGAETGWALTLSENHLVVYPSPTRAFEHSLDVLPIAFFRRDNGRLAQRLTFPATISELALGLSSRNNLVATQSNLWSLCDRAAMDSDAPPR
jgi:outer membrane protein assembly factor BamB/tetratricopeptide (TPR) repeat protein